MHDMNGKTLFIGSEVYSYAHGLLMIKAIKEEHNPDKGGALVECIRVGGGGQSMEFRTHQDKLIVIRSWKELAVQALGVQNASNLSGVVIAFASVVKEVRERLEAEGIKDSNKVNQHPICQLWADKVAHLTGTQSLGHDEVSKAYKWAYEVIEGKKAP